MHTIDSVIIYAMSNVVQCLCLRTVRFTTLVRCSAVLTFESYIVDNLRLKSQPAVDANAHCETSTHDVTKTKVMFFKG